MFYETQFLLVVLLVFLRMAPVFILNALPIFSYIPKRFKISFVAVFSWIIASLIANSPGFYTSLPDLSLTSVIIRSVLSELITGFSISLSLFLVAFFLSVSGKLWDYAHGFATLNAFNPGQDDLVSIYSKVFLVAFAFLFFVFGLHHDLILLFYFTFQEIALGSGYFWLDLSEYLSRLTLATGVMFSVSFPVVASLLAFDFLSAYVVRSNPGFNVYFIALPAKVLIGMVVFHLSISHLMASIVGLLKRLLGVF